jgi:hypothetical protein
MPMIRQMTTPFSANMPFLLASLSSLADAVFKTKQ